MPGKVELLIDGQATTTLDLPEVTLPPRRGEIAYGDTITLQVRNAGTTTLQDVIVSLRGDGAGNACLGQTRRPEDSEPVKFTGQLKPGEKYDLWARARYRNDEDEDGKDCEIVVTVKSVG